MAAVVGALRVDLGLNSAEFSAGLKKAQSGLANFAKVAGIGLAAVATAAAAAGTALGVAVKGAIDNADELSKTAQKVGVTTEALSRLNYAAGLSDVSLQQLAGGLQRLTMGMSQIAQGAGGQAKMAFDALGISALNSSGQLRSTDEVMIEVADRFARMEDGATKTALAIALFGRSGAELIPLLNMGRDGLAQMAAESDRLGATISTSTGRAAEQFNDTLTRLQSTFQGVINKIMEGALPSLNNFADRLADPAFAANAQAIGGAIVQAMSAAVVAINTVVGALTQLRDAMAWMSTHDMFGNKLEPSQWDQMRGRLDAKQELQNKLNAGNTGSDVDSLYRGIFGASPAEIVTASQEVVAAFEPVIANTRAAAGAASELKSAMSEGQAVFTATRTPAEAYAIEIERLNRLLQQGAIDQDTYNRAVLQAQDALSQAEQTGNQLASTLSSGLANVFSSIVDGSKSAAEAVGDLLKSLGQMLIHQGFQALIGGLFGGMGGGGVGGGVGNLFGNLLGFAQGGSFRVGGAGGIDSQLVAFKASPNETVSITRPDQERAGGGQVVVAIQAGEMFDARVQEVSGPVAASVLKAYDSQLKPRVQGIMAQTRQSGPLGLRR